MFSPGVRSRCFQPDVRRFAPQPSCWAGRASNSSPASPLLRPRLNTKSRRPGAFSSCAFLKGCCWISDIIFKFHLKRISSASLPTPLLEALPPDPDAVGAPPGAASRPQPRPRRPPAASRQRSGTRTPTGHSHLQRLGSTAVREKQRLMEFVSGAAHGF